MVENKYQIKLKKFGLVNWIGFTTLYLKEISRFLVVWAQTILSPLVSSLLFLYRCFPVINIYKHTPKDHISEQ